MEQESDVLVTGSGVAGLCAAISAAEAGAKVLVLEKAPYELRGGNGRFTGGGFRRVGTGYSELDFFDDLMEMSKGRTDPELAEIMVKNSADTVAWLTGLGVKWEEIDYHYDTRFKGTNRVAIVSSDGGGEGLIDTLIAAAEKLGAKILYETRAIRLLLDEKARVRGIMAKGPDGFLEFKCKAVVLASGGFEANTEMRVRYIRPDGDELKVRGTRHNTGQGLLMALEIGAQPYGQYAGYDSTIMDARTPRVEGGVTNIYHSALTVIVNRRGKRFIDEGAEFHEKMHSFGRFMFNQEEHVAFCVFDSKLRDLIKPVKNDKHRFPPIEAATLEELANKCGIDQEGLGRTIQGFNAAVQPGEFNPDIKDGKCTKGIEPPKSNWALKVDEPPYYAYPVTGGITMTFGGLKVNRDAQVIDVEDKPIPGLYATGEILGGFYYDYYLGGSGLTRGAVYGRIAGSNAALQTRRKQ